MKPVVCNIAACMLVLCFWMSSCSIGEIREEDEFTSEKIVFHYAESALYEMIYALDVSRKMSVYVNAPDNQKEAVKKKYFPNATIDVKEGVWKLIVDKIVWTFTPNDLPLSEFGGVWGVSLFKLTGSEPYKEQGSLVITNINGNSWELAVQDVESQITDRLTQLTRYDDYFSFKSHGNFRVAAIETYHEQPFYSNYRIDSGSGGFIPNKIEEGHHNVKVDYTIKSPLTLLYDTEMYVFTTGFMRMSVLDMEGGEIDSFNAFISSMPGDWEVSFY